MTSVLSPHQTEVATAFLAEQRAQRTHLVVSLSGAHAYGFPSPDSDLDLKAVHVEPTRELLGLTPRSRAYEVIRVIEGVEVDYSSNELHLVLRGVVAGNGNFVERLLGHLQPEVSAELQPLRPLVHAVLSRKVHRHYQGFARQQLHAWAQSGFSSAKKVLYVVRTALTGTHLLRTGELQTDVTQLATPYGVDDLAPLIEAKRRGEQAALPMALSAQWQARTQSLFEQLDAAKDSSALPEEPPVDAVRALDAWLLDLRRRTW